MVLEEVLTMLSGKASSLLDGDAVVIQNWASLNLGNVWEGLYSTFELFYMVIPIDTSSRTPLGHNFLWFCMNGTQFPMDHLLILSNLVCVCGTSEQM